MKIGNGSPPYADLQRDLAVLQTIPGSAPERLTVSKVEKHLDDYRKGKGELSTDTAVALNGREDHIYQSLQRLDPAALRNFGFYTTGFTYSQRARIVENVGDLADSLSNITRAYGLSKIV